MKTHVVAPGDWIGAIAATYGFARWPAIWDHEANAELRSRRGSPDLLMIGDEVAIPEDERGGVLVTTGRRAVFTARGASDMVRIRVAGLGAFIAAMGPVGYELTVGDVVVCGELTGEAQVIEAPLAVGVTKAVLILADTERFEYAIGGLGPVSEPKGVYGRLANLGFAGGPMTARRGGDDPDGPEATGSPDGADAVTDPLIDAIRGFQRHARLDPTGVLDEPTRSALLDRYGG